MEGVKGDAGIVVPTVIDELAWFAWFGSTEDELAGRAQRTCVKFVVGNVDVELLNASCIIRGGVAPAVAPLGLRPRLALVVTSVLWPAEVGVTGVCGVGTL